MRLSRLILRAQTRVMPRQGCALALSIATVAAAACVRPAHAVLGRREPQALRANARLEGAGHSSGVHTCHQGFLCLHLPQYVRHLLKGSSV